MLPYTDCLYDLAGHTCCCCCCCCCLHFFFVLFLVTRFHAPRYLFPYPRFRACWEKRMRLFVSWSLRYAQRPISESARRNGAGRLWKRTGGCARIWQLWPPRCFHPSATYIRLWGDGNDHNFSKYLFISMFHFSLSEKNLSAGAAVARQVVNRQTLQ